MEYYFLTTLPLPRHRELLGQPPDATFLGTVFSYLPLTLSKHLQAGRVDNQVGDTPFVGC